MIIRRCMRCKGELDDDLKCQSGCQIPETGELWEVYDTGRNLLWGHVRADSRYTSYVLWERWFEERFPGTPDDQIIGRNADGLTYAVAALAAGLFRVALMYRLHARYVGIDTVMEEMGIDCRVKGTKKRTRIGGES